MATYKGIQGRSVQSLSSDPGTIEDVLGQSVLNSDNIKRIYGKNRNES